MTSGISSAVRQLVKQTSSSKDNSDAKTSEGGFLNIITQSIQTKGQAQMGEDGQAVGADMLAQLIESLKKQPTTEAMEAVMMLFAQNPQLADDFVALQVENDAIGMCCNGQGDNSLEFIKGICQSKEEAERIVSFLEKLSQSQKQAVNSQGSKADEMRELFQKLGGEVANNQKGTLESENTEDYLLSLKAQNAQKQSKGADNDKDIDESQVRVFTIKDIIPADSANIDIKETKGVESPKNDRFEVINQFKQSFLENISQKRFTVRLKPEGLGEITVNMLNNDGKLSLSILASNQTVQRALEGNLSNLQSSLKQYNAQITSINETTGKQQSALDLNYGGEHNPNRQSGQNQNRHQKFDFDYTGNVSEEAQDMMELREYLMAENSLSIRV